MWPQYVAGWLLGSPPPHTHSHRAAAAACVFKMFTYGNKSIVLLLFVMKTDGDVSCCWSNPPSVVFRKCHMWASPPSSCFQHHLFMLNLHNAGESEFLQICSSVSKIFLFIILWNADFELFQIHCLVVFLDIFDINCVIRTKEMKTCWGNKKETNIFVIEPVFELQSQYYYENNPDLSTNLVGVLAPTCPVSPHLSCSLCGDSLISYVSSELYDLCLIVKKQTTWQNIKRRNIHISFTYFSFFGRIKWSLIIIGLCWRTAVHIYILIGSWPKGSIFDIMADNYIIYPRQQHS